ncbi:putative lipid II flippase FtsW [Jeotgalibacillus sp. R-1-5s-1]|uniref:putative lipid II flippase FtsW n=1 Tax=Jeotgalibacillus sp. R-1-5s-1 TaxID=2555897 RepID=UPI00106BC843|nr:putative lipid II flippase FtsW [Jeotgalibacillus sp. R-1-5s-1]TFE03573.1 putative lipid II flippase FtsW [Jeotgalibacillus sp. R-1-5s-1]
MDRWLLLLIVICTVFGIGLIDSASSVWALDRFGDAHFFSKRQGVFAFAGLFLMVMVSRIDYFVWRKYAKWIYLVSFLLLILVLIPGVGLVRNGSQSWIGAGPLSIQPAEVAKLGVLFLTAGLISRSSKKITSVRLLQLMGVIILPFGAVMLQPDLGSGTVILGTGFALLFLAGVSYRFFLLLFAAGAAGFAALIISAPYRLQRITSFLDPWEDPLGAGFQMIQSLYASGPAGLFGFGLSNSRQKHFYLPEPQNDFIFAIAAEEFGFAGGTLIMLLFLLIIWRGVLIALHAPDPFAMLCAGGIVMMIGIQVFINISVVIGLIPVTGITLPFFSYGGSSLLVILFSCGILLNISRSRSV